MLALAGALGALVVLASACTISINDRSDASRTIDVDAFDEIEITGPFLAEITVGDEPRVEVTTDDELIDLVQADVDGQRLVVGLDGGLVSTTGTLVVEITAPSLEALAASGAAEIEIEGLNGESFDLQISGASEVTADGAVTAATVLADGASRIDLDGLTLDTATVDVQGASSVEFDEVQRIEGTVRGASSVLVPDGVTVEVDADTSSRVG